MRYACGVDEKGEVIDVRDPMVERFRAVAAEAGGDPGRTVDGFLALREVFGTDLPADPIFRGLLVRLLGELVDLGAAATVKRVG